jgi:hypothetical protein
MKTENYFNGGRPVVTVHGGVDVLSVGHFGSVFVLKESETKNKIL